MNEISPEVIKKLRKKAGFSQQEAAEFFGMSYSNWKRKECLSGRVVPITKAEYFSLLLLAGEHPDLVLTEKKK
ncbi:type II toxin-antitoxin system MqsA family antitoxin [Proteus mirabilis]|uniref:helix-turn-helix domain-containing protein n=1 Tax=Proteus mirabilis TaxID=584 RepID=UPI001BAFBE39|nr:XRE family transcriptional regulator [Proteus mirabilis]MCS6741697.1 type II toxin-antitoxin system MqsA family antitoxin [Acinetobacter baumannii]EKW7428842.1 XRE family transcriptional regulator [Proteus mirabilis]MBS3881199.1 XRE family transcriptional regulator [Proteus mirabilis]MCS6721226.1 type II toxin-antitoxin system MqsA family antitoxin [Proteus mirabilis]MCS6727925.1 type II toxin-antitoxin system MqsA family antitoxin [Proteus mirabilis]